MKKVFTILATAALCCCCTGELEDRVSALEERVSTLEAKAQANADAIAQLVKASEKAVTIESVTATENGYLIKFSDGTEAVISNGETPLIGIAEVDGVYYWTINGEFLLQNGEKVPVTGKDGEDGKDGQDGAPGKDGQDGTDGQDGATPQFKIENGKWYCSFDGETWTEVPVSGEALVSVEETETAYIFHIGGSTVTIAKNLPFSIKVDCYETTLHPGESFVVKYTLTGADESTHIVVEAVNFTTILDEENCTVTVKVPSVLKSGYVMIKAVKNSDSSYAAQYINIKVDDSCGPFGSSISVSDENEYINW